MDRLRPTKRQTREQQESELWAFRHRARVRLWCDIYCQAHAAHEMNPAGDADEAVARFNEQFRRPDTEQKEG